MTASVLFRCGTGVEADDVGQGGPAVKAAKARRWRLAISIDTFRREVNVWRPDRDRTSDGTIGDAAHASRTSDHNPWVLDRNGIGVVRAIDIDKDGIDARGLADHLRHLGLTGDPRVRYVIWDRRISSSSSAWGWRRYTGSNPHTSHVHLSVALDAAGYDSGAPWGIGTDLAPPPNPGEKPPMTPTIEQIVLDRVRLVEALYATLTDRSASDDPAGAHYWIVRLGTVPANVVYNEFAVAARVV